MDTPAPPPPSRRQPPPAVVLLTALVGLASLSAVAAAGVMTFGVRSGLARQRDDLHAQLAQQFHVRDQRVDAGLVLREVALDVHMQRAQSGEFPHRPTEGLPDDPWGTPLEYERIHAQHARVRSAGPDRRFGTLDDLEEVIE